MEKIIIVGAFHEIIELSELCGKEIIGIIDNKAKENFMSYEILGSDVEAEKLFKTFAGVPLILTPDNPMVRKKLFDHYSKIGFKFADLISPLAKISSSAELGYGNVIQSQVNISSEVNIGNFVKLNSNSNIMHDTSIGNFTTVAPNAVVLGRVIVGELSYIGSNSTILPERQIGANSIVGAGSVVTRDVSGDIIVAGNPARFLKKNEAK